MDATHAAANEEVLSRILDFFMRTGLGVRYAELPESFLPGVSLERGGLVIDRGRLRYPGDLLHEAGHLAVMTPDRRASGPVDVITDMGEEIAAQCWSYAATVHLGVAPEVVFHEHGYKGSAQTLIEQYRNGSVGVPLMQWMGLTWDAAHAAEAGEPAWPHMRRWLRQQGAVK